MSETVRFVLSAVLLGLGVITMLVAVLGVFRFKFVLNRMHCASVIDTLGMLLIMAGLVVASGSLAYIPKLALILLLLWISSPLASHLVSRMEITTDESAGEYMKKKEVE